MVGARAARHARIRYDDVGRAETRDEIASRIRKRRSISNVACVNGDTRRRQRCGDARKLRLAPREESDSGVPSGVMARKRLADARRRAGDEDA
jgi:hypothetical protein